MRKQALQLRYLLRVWVQAQERVQVWALLPHYLQREQERAQMQALQQVQERVRA